MVFANEQNRYIARAATRTGPNVVTKFCSLTVVEITAGQTFQSTTSREVTSMNVIARTDPEDGSADTLLGNKPMTTAPAKRPRISGG